MVQWHDMEKTRLESIPHWATRALALALAFANEQSLAHDGIEAHATHRMMSQRFTPPWSGERGVVTALTANRPVARLEAIAHDRSLTRALAQSEATFTMIGLPDTQNYSEFFPSTFMAQTEWIGVNRTPLGIRFVSHFGDVVNHALDVTEWKNADIAMRVLDELGVIYGVCPGNHDITPEGTPSSPYVPQQYLEFFGAQRWSDRPWFGGASPSGMSTYQCFNAGGVPFLALHLDCDTPIAELAWAQGILDKHKDRPTLVTTHKYLQDAEDYVAGVPIVPSGRYPSSWYLQEGFYNPYGVQAEEFFAWFLRKNTNIFLVQCGHFHEEYRQASVNVDGRIIHEVLADFQDDPNGGDGWLRVMRFDTEEDRIDFETYSPTLRAIRMTDESHFSLSVPFDAYSSPEGTQFRAFQEGVGDYAGTRDTWVSEATPDTSYGQSSTRVSDDDVNNAILSDAAGQALIRFENIFGVQGIPADATVTSATLVLDIPDDIDSPLYDPDFFVYLVERPWTESSTWNSLSDGLTVGSDLSALIAVFGGDSVPDSDTMRRIDITSAVRLWQQGHPNFGIAILPEIIVGNDDGIAIRTRENPNTILRPRLEVVFTQAEPRPRSDLTGDAIVNAADLTLLLSAWDTQDPFADLDRDGFVGAADLAMLLTGWS